MYQSTLRKTAHWTQDWPLPVQYAVAIGAIILALVLRWALDGALLDKLPWITIFIVLLPLVILVRPLPFLTAALLASVATNYFFIPPRHSLLIHGPMAELQVGLFILAVIAAAVTAWLSKRALDRMRGADSMLRAFVDESPTCKWVTDSHGRIVYVNNAMASALGLEVGQILGRTHDEILPPKLAQLAVQHMRAVRESGQACTSFEEIEPLDGRARRILEWRRFLLHVGDRDHVLVAGMANDITERRKAEQALQASNERAAADLQAMTRLRQEAETASQAKDRFLAVLSHELRTPLTPVLMAATAMDADPDLPPSLRDDVAMIRRNVETEARLIDDLLDLSRVTTGKLRLNIEAVDVSAAVRHACETCRPFLLEKGVELHCDLPEPAPFASADPARLQQVLWNLLRNAAKFTPRGGRIGVAVSTTGQQRVRIQVRDTGIGINADVLPRIFNAFEQGDASVTRQYGGMGLGLAIAKALLEMHDGVITAQSDGPGKGSVFTIELPALAAGQAVPPRPQRSHATSAAGHLRVLVVEDHSDTAQTIARLLGAAGHAVKTAHTAAAALQLAGAERFDLIVSDIGLPDGTGYELMRQLKARFAMRGIAISGFGSDEDLRKSLEAGFSDHIVKPASGNDLERAIRRVTADGDATAASPL